MTAAGAVDQRLDAALFLAFPRLQLNRQRAAGEMGLVSEAIFNYVRPFRTVAWQGEVVHPLGVAANGHWYKINPPPLPARRRQKAVLLRGEGERRRGPPLIHRFYSNAVAIEAAALVSKPMLDTVMRITGAQTY